MGFSQNVGAGAWVLGIQNVWIYSIVLKQLGHPYYNYKAVTYMQR